MLGISDFELTGCRFACIIVLLDVPGKTLWKLLLNFLGGGVLYAKQEVIIAGMADERASRIVLVQHIADDLGSAAHYLITRHRAIFLGEGNEVLDLHIEEDAFGRFEDARQAL